MAAESLQHRLPPPPLPWRGWLSAAIVIGILSWSAWATEASFGALFDGLPNMWSYVHDLFPSAERPWPLHAWREFRGPLIETIKLALAATIVGGGLALPFALVGTRHLAGSKTVYNIARGGLNLLRTVPDLVMASLLVASLGLGALPGLVALIVFTFGVVAKLLADTVETVDAGPMEAISAAGGTQLQRAIFAVLPQVGPDYVAYTLYAFEINIRVAAVLGLVGAGGIGQILYADILLFRFGRIGMVITVTFAMVLLIDSLSNWIRSKLV